MKTIKSPLLAPQRRRLRQLLAVSLALAGGCGSPPACSAPLP